MNGIWQQLQLVIVAVITSKIEDPENTVKTAKEYVKAITKSFDEK